jgi:hypothetical protein
MRGLYWTGIMAVALTLSLSLLQNAHAQYQHPGTTFVGAMGESW